MLVALAMTLDELHERYSGAQIVARIRRYYELEDGIGKLADAALFEHATRDFCTHAVGIKREAQIAYIEYCLTGRVGYKVARCLLPGKLERVGIEI